MSEAREEQQRRDREHADAVRRLITGEGASKTDQDGLAAAKRISAAQHGMCLYCGRREPVGGDEWWRQWCAVCLQGWVPQYPVQDNLVVGEFPRDFAMDGDGLCGKCGIGQRLGREAQRGENPTWCGNCNFERTDLSRRRRVEPGW